VTFDAPAGADVTLRVRHYDWLTVDNNAVVAASGAWTLVRVRTAGRYTVTS
jgi:hypothetical protein